jgi:hypothetical protein
VKAQKRRGRMRCMRLVIFGGSEESVIQADCLDCISARIIIA